MYTETRSEWSNLSWIYGDLFVFTVWGNFFETDFLCTTVFRELTINDIFKERGSKKEKNVQLSGSIFYGIECF